MQLPEYQLLSLQLQEIMVWSALLHDVAKPHTTREENNRIVSPRHAAVGEKVSREMLWDMPFTQREQICALVRLHGLPLWSLDKDNPNRSVISSSLRVRNDLIYLLAKADVLGRISVGQREYLDRLEYFKELCIENECFTSPKQFYNAHSQFRFFQTDAPYAAEIYDDTAFEITILSGLPGSGKDTYASSLDLPVISLDALRKTLKIKPDDRDGQGLVAQEAYQMAKMYARKKQSFIWNSTNLTKMMRDKIINTLSVYNPRFRLIYVESSLEKMMEHRGATIPVARLREMVRRLELPLPEEVHSIEYRRR
jgi:predicted kinase